jgi:8-oxo-dGTP pyrophosphatase MutT (NUDIX family)
MPAASILPVALHKGKLYFLFGKENPLEDSAKGFSDFGGGIDPGETAFDAALREASEELTGFIGSKSDIQRHTRRHGGKYTLVHSTREGSYTVHIIQYAYDPILPFYYNNNHKFLWKRMDNNMLNDSKLFEKIEIDWFCENELKRREKEYRPFYREVVDHILSELPQIRKFVKKCYQNFRTKRRTMKGGRNITGGR